MFGHHRAGEAISAEALGIGRLFDRLRDAVVVADQHGQIVLWNPAASQTFGYSSEEVLGESVELLVAPELRDRYRAGIGHWRETGTGRYLDAGRLLELPARHRDGSGLQLEMSLSSLDDEEGRRYVLAMIRDVTAFIGRCVWELPAWGHCEPDLLGPAP